MCIKSKNHKWEETRGICLSGTDFIHVIGSTSASSIFSKMTWFYSLLVANEYSIVLMYLYHTSLILSSIGWFYCHKALTCSLLGKYTGTSRAHGISTICCLRDLHTDFHGSCCQGYIPIGSVYRVLSSYPQQHLMLFVFLMTAVLIRGRCNLNTIWICVSLRAND